MASKKSKFLHAIKYTIRSADCIMRDISEICTFTLQGRMQGFYWNSSQTCHHFVIYVTDSIPATVAHGGWVGGWDSLKRGAGTSHILQQSK